MGITRRDFLKIGGAVAGAGTLGMPPIFTFAAGNGRADGMSWPRDQALPSFSRPEHLDVANLRGLSGDDQTLLTTLQGVVNRSRPRLYYLLAGDGTDQTWLDTVRVPYTVVADPWSLISRYRDEVDGVIVYDPDVPDSLNVATMLAGLHDAVVASPAQAKKLAGASYGLPLLQDLKGRFTGKVDAYSWALANLWPQLTHRVLTAISPTDTVSASGVRWTTLAQVTQHVHDASNRAIYTLDLTSQLGGDAVYVRFQNAFQNDGWGPSVFQVTVLADGSPLASFQPTTPAEQPYLYDADGSSTASGGWRFADGGSYFIYRFAPPAGTRSLVMKVEMWNQYLVTATNTSPTVRVGFPNFRDYIVATKAFLFWLDPDVPDEAALFTQILSKVDVDTPYLGWFVGGHESHGVTLCSQHGVVVLAADFFNNGTVFGGIPGPVSAEPRPKRTPALENKVYVTLTLSEGDNIQYDQHKMRELWDDPARGRVPLNWSVSPLLLDMAPSMLSHFQRTATANDLLLAGPSGAGYTYPGLWPGTTVDSFTELTGRYMRRTGMDVIYALNRDGDRDIPLSDAVAASYVRNVEPLGILYNWESRSQVSTSPSGLPIATQIGIGSTGDGQGALAAAIKSWDGKSPLFVALGVLAWSMGPTEVAALVASLGSQYQVVRGDVFFKLLRRSLGLKEGA